MQKVFQQNLNETQRDGSVFIIQLLFKTPVKIPKKEKWKL